MSPSRRPPPKLVVHAVERKQDVVFICGCRCLFYERHDGRWGVETVTPCAVHKTTKDREFKLARKMREEARPK